MLFNKTILRKDSAEGFVTKEIQFGQVKTQNIIDGKAYHTKTHDIKRLGFPTVDEYIAYLTSEGYTIIE